MIGCKRLGVAAVAIACALSTHAPGATVKKADDTTVTGPLVALENGAVVLNVNDASGKPQRTPIALEDVVELTVDAAADGVVAPSKDAASQPAAAQAAAAVSAPDMINLFDGKTLKGWVGEGDLWSVRDGVLVGSVTDDKISNMMTFLRYEGEFSDFELHYKFKIEGGLRNSTGIQFRSTPIEHDGMKDVKGYQQDLGVPPGAAGGLVDNLPSANGQSIKASPGERALYDVEGTRTVEALPKTGDALNALIKDGDWNDAVLVAKGNKFVSMINGTVFAEVVNNAPGGAKSGVFAIQLSRRRVLTVQLKDIRLRKLGTGDKPAVTGLAWTDPPAPAVTAAPPTAAGEPPKPAAAPVPDADATAKAGEWQVRPIGGDRIKGELLAWDDQNLKLKTEFGELTFPVKQLSEVWHASADDIRKARAVVRSDKAAGQVTEDVAFARKDDQVIPVAGLVLGVESGGSLKFRFRDQERKIQADKLVGVILASAEDENAAAAAALADDKLRQTLVLGAGDVMSGQWTALENGQVALTTNWGTTLKVPIKQVEKIQTKNGRLTYVSDVKPAQVEQTPYFDRMLPYRTDYSLTGQAIKLADASYTKGISVHSRTVLRYDIGRRFERFRAKVGFQQPEGKAGRATIRVLGDGDKVLHEIADARGDQPPADLDIPVAGVSRLTLEVDFGADQDVGDRVAWANARLLRAAKPSVR